MKYLSKFCVAGLLLCLSGCATMGPGETTGTVVGGVTGGLLGSLVGAGTGNLVAVGVGAGLGSAVGGALGRQADAQNGYTTRPYYYPQRSPAPSSEPPAYYTSP